MSSSLGRTCCARELRAAARTKSSQSAFQHGEARGAGAPTLAKELLTVDGFWEKESQFSLELWPLIGQPPSSGWPHIQVYGWHKLKSVG